MTDQGRPPVPPVPPVLPAPSAGDGFDTLHAEAKAALSAGANTLRGVRDRYRELYTAELAAWQELHDSWLSMERRRDPGTVGDGPAEAEERARTYAEDRDLRLDADRASAQLGLHQAELARLELALRNLETTWLFLERGDNTLVSDDHRPVLTTEVQMRIVEAQEAERARLAQEVHDGPAQALTNAIFQVEYIERVVESDTRLARTELRFLRELLRRELGDVRSFISQLRPPVLVELGLDGSIVDAAETMATLSGVHVTTELAAPSDALGEAEQTVALRIVQEALQNVRKHAAATNAVVATRLDGEDWTLEVHDDGRGFDTGVAAVRGRRNFGLQFMRERAEVIGARFDVRSRPDGGTLVRLTIPVPRKENG